MFRGLDYRTTEEQIHRRLRDLTKVPIKDVRLITDKYTNKSRGFAFVEVTSVAVSRFFNHVAMLSLKKSTVFHLSNLATIPI